ncbi:MAG: DUF4280 domain-containing protein [Lachnospiraceae bacterium]|nr:DUF4280 domain-containing protein [Lachnospiraceae bacterium]
MELMESQEQKKQFVRRLMVAACECGSLEYQYLNLPEDHGVYFEDVDHPLMNANDHEGNKHIMQFGRCDAEANPKNIMSNMLAKVSPAFALINKAKEAMGCEGCKCSPMVINSWAKGDTANRLDGAPCITNESTLHCLYGGLIKITEIPKSADEDENADNVDAPEEEEYNPLDTVPEAMQDKINSMNENAASESDSSAQDSSADAGAGNGPESGNSAAGNGAAGGTGGGSSMTGGASGGGMSGGASWGDMGDASGLLSDAQQWYQDNGQDFMEMYAVSDALIDQNYMRNRAQVLNPACFNDEGFIADASLLDNFNMGGSNLARIGGSCIAAFNLMRVLGAPMEMCDIIRDAERRQTVKGFMDEGPMGISLCSMVDGMRSKGMSAKLVCGERTISSALKMKAGEAAVLGISDKGKTQFCTLKCGAAGKISCAERPEMSVEKMCSVTSGKKMAMMKVGSAKKFTEAVKDTGLEKRKISSGKIQKAGVLRKIGQ